MKDNFYHNYEKNNHSTNVYKTKKHLSSQTLEKKKKKTTIHDIENSATGLGQSQSMINASFVSVFSEL